MKVERKTLRNGLLSRSVHMPSLRWVLIFGLLAFMSLLLSLSIGEVTYGPLRVLRTLVGRGEAFTTLVINGLRLPRVLGGFLVGASLGTSGLILQGITKNPLASPGVLGIVNGGAVGALTFLFFFTDPRSNALAVSILYMPLAVMAGAFLIALLIDRLAMQEGMTPLRLILVGIALSGAARALVTLLILKGPMVFVAQSNLWLTGTLHGTNGDDARVLLGWFLFWSVPAFYMMRELDAMAYDDALSMGIGVRLFSRRRLLLLISVALSSGAVALGGGIGFVGLLAPHISRRLGVTDHEWLYLLTIPVGGAVVVISDLLARTLFAPLDLPVGIFTAAVGAPYFIFLLWKQRR